MTTTITTTFINCGSERGEISLGIFDVCNGTADSIEYLNSYEHPQHPGSADWTIGVYRIMQDGMPFYAASTNGDPVWQEEDVEVWANMLAEYEIDPSTL